MIFQTLVLVYLVLKLFLILTKHGLDIDVLLLSVLLHQTSVMKIFVLHLLEIEWHR
jgi:hypothetical protein